MDTKNKYTDDIKEPSFRDLQHAISNLQNNIIKLNRNNF